MSRQPPRLRDALAPVLALRADPDRVARVARALRVRVASPSESSASGGVTCPSGAGRLPEHDAVVAAEVAEALREAPFGLSAAALAAQTRRGKARVLAALHADPRFVLTGRGRGARWRVRGPEPQGTDCEALRRVGSGRRANGVVRDAEPGVEPGEFAAVGRGRGRLVEPEGVPGRAASSGAAASAGGRCAR